MPSFPRPATLLWLHLVSRGVAVTELVALVPNQGPTTVLNWVNVTYPSDVASCDEVSFSPADGAAALGAWDGLDLKVNGFKLTGKNYGKNLYGYLNTGRAADDGSCCADTMRIWSQVDGSTRDIDLVAPLAAVFNRSSWAFATHTFDIVEIDGVVAALCMAQFEEDGAELNKAKVDAIVAVSMVRY